MPEEIKLIAPTLDLREDNGRLSARRIAELFGVSTSDLSRWLDRSKPLLSKTPDADSYHDLLLPFESIARLREALGGDEPFREWLRNPHVLLGRRPPLEIIASAGPRVVADLSEDMMSGQPS